MDVFRRVVTNIKYIDSPDVADLMNSMDQMGLIGRARGYVIGDYYISVTKFRSNPLYMARWN
jgi:hypothetical protein